MAFANLGRIELPTVKIPVGKVKVDDIDTTPPKTIFGKISSGVGSGLISARKVVVANPKTAVVGGVLVGGLVVAAAEEAKQSDDAQKAGGTGGSDGSDDGKSSNPIMRQIERVFDALTPPMLPSWADVRVYVWGGLLALVCAFLIYLFVVFGIPAIVRRVVARA